ncbi:MAG: tRNA adenosine(34) deaminase TadA [Clostridia bacterium]|nr:tRNA adenosine(34) deaminase TadA [Clostridia bacterium]
MNNDKEYMKIAVDEAKKAYDAGEVPVGAIIVKDGKIISQAHNNREETGDATGHAETLAIRMACDAIGSWRLEDCELYVTLEPCPMCMGAIINSRIKRVVFGAKDAKAGACGSIVNLASYPFNHKPIVDNGVMTDDCAKILSDFFVKKR